MFALVLLFCDWFAKLWPRLLSQPLRNKTKTNHDLTFSWCHLHVFASNSDCFIAQFVSVVIG